MIIFGIVAAPQWLIFLSHLAALLKGDRRGSGSADCHGTCCGASGGGSRGNRNSSSSSNCRIHAAPPCHTSRSDYLPHSSPAPPHSSPTPAAPSRPSIRLTGIDLGFLSFHAQPSSVADEAASFYQAFAATLGVDFAYRSVSVQPESFRPGMVEVHPGEEVLVCSCWSMMALPDSNVLRFNLRDAVLQVRGGGHFGKPSTRQVLRGDVMMSNFIHVALKVRMRKWRHLRCLQLFQC